VKTYQTGSNYAEHDITYTLHIQTIQVSGIVEVIDSFSDLSLDRSSGECMNQTVCGSYGR